MTEMLDILLEERLKYIENKMENSMEDKVNDRVNGKIKDMAKKALREGLTIEFTRKITGLDEPTLKNLQVELQTE